MRKITLQTLDKVTSFTLGDDSAGVWIADYRAFTTFMSQTVPGVRSSHVTLHPRANELWSITFTVQQAYADAATAWAAYHAHADELPGQGILTVIQNTVNYYFPDATKQKLEPIWRGDVGIDWTYHFLSSQRLTSLPS